MTQFKEALLAELSEQVTTEDPARRPVRGLMAAATGVAAIIAAVTIGVVALPSQQEPAFAVTKQPDGTYRLTMRDLYYGNVDDVNRALRDAGVQAKVIIPGPAGSCPAHPIEDMRRSLNRVYISTGREPGRGTIDIPRFRHDKGKTLLLIVRKFDKDAAGNSRPWFYTEAPVVDLPAPPCVEITRAAGERLQGPVPR